MAHSPFSALAFTLFTTGPVWAVPILSVDLDPSVPGIQSSLDVVSGASFDVDVLFTGDGVAAFDATIFDPVFNDAGQILGLVGVPVAGAIADTVPGGAFDLSTFASVFGGDPLGTNGELPPAGFAGNVGVVGLLALGTTFGPGAFSVGEEVGVLSLSFTATTPGTSTIALVPFPLGSPMLALGGIGVPVTLESGTVTVRAASMPEGTSLYALALCVAALLGTRAARRA